MAARTATPQLLKGLTGATAASRYVGATVSGPPTTGTFAVGDFIVDQSGWQWVCITAGSPGTWWAVGRCLTGTVAARPAAGAETAGRLYLATDVYKGALYRSSASAWSLAAAPVDVQNYNQLVGSPYPSGALAETYSRVIPTNTAIAAGTTGQLRMVIIWLPADYVITSITFFSGATALASGTHAWVALYSASRVLLRQSTDDTSPTWAANVAKTFTLSSTYTVTIGAFFYLGLLIAATTVPSLSGSNSGSALNALAPIASGTADGSLTGTAPNPAAALTALAGTPYAYVS